jgi:hypothetical protein
MKFFEDVDFVVDESIWGHRLYDEQLPHLIFLEFLGVLASQRDHALTEIAGQVSYKPQRQLRLRGVLFNNPYIASIAASKNKSDEAKWEQWLSRYVEGAAGGDDMSYLKTVFSSFDDFARIVELLQSSAFEVNSNKRWSSKFVFPFGSDALYEDLRVDVKGSASNDRRFFARTGELLYLMLCRATRKDELKTLLLNRLLDTKAPLNRLVKTIQGGTEFSAQEKVIQSGHLPLASHPRFDQICDDWIHILEQDMPAYDAIQYLMTSVGLNLILYFLERSKEVLADDQPVQMLCEIVSKDRTKIRTLSSDGFQSNQNLSLRAVSAAVASVHNQADWVNAATADYPEAEYVRLMKARFQWPTPDEENQSWTPEKLIHRLTEKALARHHQHLGKVHATWSKSIGLSSRRLSRRTRYAPNDHFLKCLVIMVVGQRMQFDDFLAEIHRRYGLLIGESQGQSLIENNQLDQEALSRNSEYLAARLSSLGLLRQLSDGCAFVENPFSSQGDDVASE